MSLDEIRRTIGRFVAKPTRACDLMVRKIIGWPEWMMPGSGMGAAFGQYAFGIVTLPMTGTLALPFALGSGFLHLVGISPPAEKRTYRDRDRRPWVQVLDKTMRLVDGIFNGCLLIGFLPLALPGEHWTLIVLKLIPTIPLYIIGMGLAMPFLLTSIILHYIVEWRHEI